MSSSQAYRSTSGPDDVGHPATGDGNRQSERAAERRREILRADPYYPHTALRAVTMWFVLGLFCLGFAALATLVLPDREFGWYYVLTSGVIATVFAGGQLLLHRFRVGRLEDWGRIPREQ